MNRTQRFRLATRAVFFALFVLAPPLDLFRLDLTRGHFLVLGMDWTLDLYGVSPAQAALHLLWRAFVPVAAVIGFGVWLSWRLGRVYCGWLCPHFSVVELINGLMRRACGRVSLWQRTPPPEEQADGTRIHPWPGHWITVALAVAGFAFLWAVTLLSYLLAPATVWGDLLAGTLSRNQALFLGVATTLFALEFTLARHLFCRFGCAVGLFQSLVWMANPRALVVGFDRAHAEPCLDCDRSCEHACPMLLRPRRIKRHMFTCTQCQQCVQACEAVNRRRGRAVPLQMLSGRCALDVSERDFGRRPEVPADCFGRASDAGADSRRITLPGGREVPGTD